MCVVLTVLFDVLFVNAGVLGKELGRNPQAENDGSPFLRASRRRLNTPVSARLLQEFDRSTGRQNDVGFIARHVIHKMFKVVLSSSVQTYRRWSVL